MKTWTLLTNIMYADIKELKAMKMWCNGILIDNDKTKGLSEGNYIRQLKGLSWGGLSVFTLWIDPYGEVTFEDNKGGKVVMLQDNGETLPLDSSICIKVNSIEVLRAYKDHLKQPIYKKVYNHPPFGNEYDKLVLPCSSGNAYPRTIWTPIPNHLNRR